MSGHENTRARPLILFGAFDRHNFGDMLLAHCAARESAPTTPIFAGLANRDLRPYGGHAVRRLDDVIAEMRHAPADLVHVGGELLTTTAWEAAVMLQSPADAARAIRLYGRYTTAQREWARAFLGHDRQLPYVIPASGLPKRWHTHFRPVGGVAMDSLPQRARNEAFKALREATSLRVRDAVTQAVLRAQGIDAPLQPDPVASLDPTGLLPAGPTASLRNIAVQVATEWGDDQSLDALAAHLRAAAARLDAGITLFRAGLAPWHDDLATLAGLAERLRNTSPVTIHESAHIGDICRLLAGARAYVGSSLHAWIVAHRFGVRAECLVRNPSAKAVAYLDTWHRTPRRWRTLGERLLD